ncbi:hypothetical protein GGS23DRAFT_607733 [Durotheca rogersii]|uniref:uncharacterized protein n=1 Tax=Durotheca rogersii TaxID=419775 RepID=UPI002220799E|nr:uncharacterized protein GGS23DRAFT_607733 [Durotheca rogersii]KAI5858208.1 hypothetical protein GGS23DRAFT_607733 [Durotheca rogersii]
MPYLNHIIKASSAWPHLRHLAQWMEVTTSPNKWQLIKSCDDLHQIRAERARRTKVAAIDFAPSQPNPVTELIEDPEKLQSDLDRPLSPGATRLYIVEDLSRDVIECLGYKLNIDPLFFREHINDYLWYNTRDPWVELPDLDMVSRNRPYFRLIYTQPRYFKDKQSVETANRQAGRFNVLRRLDLDTEHRSLFDEDSAIVALVRSKASLWIAPDDSPRKGTGVLLIDPSITQGYPLWRGYRPFRNSPCPFPEHEGEYDRAPGTSLFDDLLFWIQKTEAGDIDAIRESPRAMAFRMLQIICAEWLTLTRYITARLSQIEWEIEKPDFRRASTNFNTSLEKLHTWRRRLPLYRAMVADAREKLFPDAAAGAAGAARGPRDSVEQLRRDYAIVARHIEELLSRAERIAAVATAVTAIEESRRAIEQNKALGRLTYLAVIFAPLSFVSSFFSMTDNVASQAQTYWVYFCIAIPISILAFLLVDQNWTNNIQRVRGSSAKQDGKPAPPPRPRVQHRASDFLRWDQATPTAPVATTYARAPNIENGR